MTLFAERGPAEDALKTRKLNGKGDDQMFDQWSNILNFLMYLGVTLPLLGVGSPSSCLPRRIRNSS